MMRSTGNFSPEWGYLAPAPSMLPTVRVLLVATAIGATAGAGVVLSLVDHSVGDGDKVAVAARAIVVTSVQAAPVQAPVMSEATIAPEIAPAAAAPVAQTPVQKPVQAAALGQTPPQAQAAPQIQTAPQVQAAAHDNTALAVTAPAQDAATASATAASITNDAAAVPQQPAVAALSGPNVATPGAPVASTDATGDQGIVGPQQTAQQKKAKRHNSSFSRDFPPVIGPALWHLFSARAGTSNYPNRAY
jgi:hypothetical protein